ncbi:hypothetical protein P8452_66672 [Trifolium repens]|nr:hypothetical protein P8452_66670 [Trifolium repens]WJX84062.1 hypothetical protein P8452_66672 [Trifolium repens]
MRIFGVILEDECPYTGILEKPKNWGSSNYWYKPIKKRKQEAVFKVKSFKQIKYDEVKKYVEDHGPVIIRCVLTEMFDRVGTDIYRVQNEEKKKKRVRTYSHFMVIVGHGKKMINDVWNPYWIVRNSYGPDHWDEGYVKIIMDPDETKSSIKEFWCVTEISKVKIDQ